MIKKVDTFFDKKVATFCCKKVVDAFCDEKVTHHMSNKNYSKYLPVKKQYTSHDDHYETLLKAF